MELQVGVKALLKNTEGKYLLVRRNPKKYPEVGSKWDIPGGRINPGSPLMENLKREIKEETNLDLLENPMLIAAQDILRVPGRHVVRLTYIGIIEGQPQIDSENLEYKWFTAEELKTEPELDNFLKEIINTNQVKI